MSRCGYPRSGGYGPDAVGNRESVTDGSGPTNYTYDSLYRLTGVDWPTGPDDTYTYDANGNRTTKNATSYVYDSADQLQSVGGAFYWQDNNGNIVIKDGTQSFSYDFENRMFASNFGFSATYNGDGLRMTTSVPPYPSNLVNYTWDVNSPLPVVIQDTNNTYVYGLDLISSTNNSGTTTFYTGDGLGSTTDLTNEAGAVTDSYTYDVFGAQRSHIGSSTNYWQFTGEQSDGVLNPNDSFQYLRARYYDTATGRFMSRDTFPAQRTQPQTLNQFAYVMNNPTTLVDPTGLNSELNHGSVGVDALVEELVLQDCIKLTVVAIALLALAVGFLLLPSLLPLVATGGAVTVLGAFSALNAAITAGASAGVGYAAYEICKHRFQQVT